MLGDAGSFSQSAAIMTRLVEDDEDMDLLMLVLVLWKTLVFLW